MAHSLESARSRSGPMDDGADPRHHPASPTFQNTAACMATASRFAVFESCPQCDGPMRPEHAHFRCASCGWRDSCCD